MRLVDHLKLEGIRIDFTASDKPTTLRELAKLAADADASLDPDTVYRVFEERERLATTGVGSGVAIPHGRLPVSDFRVAVAICRDGVPFDAVDGKPARILVAVLAPEGRPAGQLKMLARVSRVLKEPAVRERLISAATEDEALEILRAEDSKL